MSNGNNQISKLFSNENELNKRQEELNMYWELLIPQTLKKKTSSEMKKPKYNY